MVKNGFIPALTRLITGISHPAIDTQEFKDKPVVYYANHSSHLDFLVIWSCLPSQLREQTSPVAARDYWGRTKLRTWIAKNLFKAILIERKAIGLRNNPIIALADKLNKGDSIIIFPEGTRSIDGKLQPFQSGIYHLARRCPDVLFIPVWLENINRILPKGHYLPVPLLGHIEFGSPIKLNPKDTKIDFMQRAFQALERISPQKQL